MGPAASRPHLFFNSGEDFSVVSACPAIALAVIALLLGAVIYHLTRNGNLAYWISFVLVLGITALYVVDSSIFVGLLPDIMEKLSLFERFNVFVNGVFDMTAIVFYVTVIAFFLFLSVQSLEKRRYN